MKSFVWSIAEGAGMYVIGAVTVCLAVEYAEEWGKCIKNVTKELVKF